MIHEQFRAYRADVAGRPAAACSSASSWSTWPARSSAWAVSGPGRSSCCSRGATTQDPLFLQVKEATASVLEDLPAEEPVRPARRAGGAGAADDAGRQRHLPRLDRGAGRRPALLLASAARHEGLGRGRGDGRRSGSRSTPAPAGGRWRGPTPDPGTRSPSPHTSARATRSTSRSPTSQNATPTRTNRTTRNSSTRSSPDGSKQSRASDDPVRLARATVAGTWHARG